MWGWQDICVCVRACLRAHVFPCLCERPWGRCTVCPPMPCFSVYASVFVPVCAAASHLVCLGPCSHVSVFSVSVRACATACAHLCPWTCQRVRLHGVGTPACAYACTPPARAHSFFGTDTLPPSAQTNSKSLPAGSEPAAAGAPGHFSFLFCFLQPSR